MCAVALRVTRRCVQEGHDRVHDTAGHQRLRTVLQRDLVAVGRQQPAVVVVDLERAALADGVDDEQIAALALQFRPGVEQHVAVGVARLGREADDGAHVGQLTVGACPDRAREHVVGARQLDGRRVRGVPGSWDFLILLVATWVGPEVGDRGRHHQHVRVGGMLGHRVVQLARRADVHDVDAGRVDETRGVARRSA